MGPRRSKVRAVGITHFVARVAGRLGILCHEAGSAEAIQALALVHPTALIFLDLSLGRGDAVQVLKFLTAHKFAGSVVLISGHEQGVLDHVTDIGRRPMGWRCSHPSGSPLRRTRLGAY
jgi:DNA-binding response OmpR family regulator